MYITIYEKNYLLISNVLHVENPFEQFSIFMKWNQNGYYCTLMVSFTHFSLNLLNQLWQKLWNQYQRNPFPVCTQYNDVFIRFSEEFGSNLSVFWTGSIFAESKHVKMGIKSRITDFINHLHDFWWNHPNHCNRFQRQFNKLQIYQNPYCFA